MNDILRFDTPADYCRALGVEPRNRLVEMIDFEHTTKRLTSNRMTCGFFLVFLKDVKCGNIVYGQQTYDYQARTLVFIGPGQVYGFVPAPVSVRPKGRALLFHPDLLRGTPLAHDMKDYGYFSYETNEALHLAEEEQRTVLECLDNISAELDNADDRHSRRLIVSNIELFLNYSLRFYDRQFATREKVNHDILVRFEHLLNDYVTSGRARREGQPSVKICATTLNLSPNYFGDLIKRETGVSASSHIHRYLINMAKNRIFDPQKSISEIAYDMGFQYPQHFSRLFKKETGLTPKEYRAQARL